MNLDFTICISLSFSRNMGDGNLKVGGSDSSIVLANKHVDDVSYLEFVEPCPKIDWAGKFKHDQSFLLNSFSDNTDNLQIIVMNPTANIRSLKKEKEDGRLQTSTLWYREVGQVLWEEAITFIEVENNGYQEPRTEHIDFVLHGEENGYGLISNIQWSIKGYVPQGTYEIIIKSTCGKPITANDEFDFYITQPIVGIVDYTPPKQYGSISPLYNEVLLSEELETTFTEPLNCARPFTFDVELRVGNETFDKDNLQIVCEGRKIGLLLDPTYLSVEV